MVKEAKKTLEEVTSGKKDNTARIILSSIYLFLMLIGGVLLYSKVIDASFFTISVLISGVLFLMLSFIFVPEERERWNNFFSEKMDKDKVREMILYGFFVIFLFSLIYLSAVFIKISLPNNFDINNLNFLFLIFVIIVVFLIEILSAMSNHYSGLYQYVVLLFLFFILLLNILGIKSFIFIMILCIGYVFVSLPQIYDSWQKPKWRVLWTIFIMVIFIIFGICFIDSLYGYHPTTIHFNNCSNTSQRSGYTMNCTSKTENQELIAEYRTGCMLNDTTLSNLSGFVNFGMPNGDKKPENFSDGIEFTPPRDAIDTYFRINASCGVNCTLCMDSGIVSFDKNFKVLFPSLEDKKSDREKYVAYLIGLLGIILFSVPVFMKNIKDLSN